MFFDALFYKGIKWYRSYYKHATKERALCDISPTYLHHPKVPKRIKEMMPSVKIVLILRDPVERAFSHYVDLIGWGYTKGSFLEVLQDPVEVPRGREKIQFDIFEMGLYGKHVGRYLECFSRDQIGVFLFDDMRDDCKCFLAKLCKFIGVTDLPLEALDAGKTYHAARMNRVKWIGKLLNHEATREAARVMIPAKLFGVSRSIYQLLLDINASRMDLPQMPAREAAHVFELYKQDMEQLERICEVNLDSWKCY
jgi:hypothetical protein